MIVIKLRVKACAVLEAASVQSCRVITIDIKCVKDVRVLRVRIFFPSLLKEYKDMLGVFYPRCNQPRTIRIPSGGARRQNFFQVCPLGGFKKFSFTRVCLLPVKCNCGTHNSNLRTTILRAVPWFW